MEDDKPAEKQDGIHDQERNVEDSTKNEDNMEKDQEIGNSPTTGHDTEGVKKKSGKEKIVNIVAFYAFGTLIYTVYSVIIAGAQDILAGTFIPTAAVLVTNVGPYFLVTMLAPYFIHHVPYSVRIVFIYFTFTAGLFTIVYAKEVFMKLVGICLTSLGAGTGEVSFFTLTAFYEQVTVSAYSAGTGTGFVLGPLYYTGLTTWCCITPNRTMLIMAGSPLLYVIFYIIMDKKHTLKTNAEQEKVETVDTQSEEVLSWKEKFSTAYEILPLVVSLFIAYVCEYVTIQAIITTMAFPNAPFPPRVHYRYYIFIFLAGEFVARSYLAIVTSIKPSLVPKILIRRIWVLSLILVLHFAFFLAASWYRFIHDVWVVFTFIFTAGLVAGAAFANAFIIVSESTAARYKEFAMGFATIGMGAGTFLAGAVGLLLEPYIREHCLGISKIPDYCFTRPFGGWNATSGSC